MQLKEQELHLILRASMYYRNNVAAHDDIVDELDSMMEKVKNYLENYSTI